MTSTAYGSSHFLQMKNYEGCLRFQPLFANEKLRRMTQVILIHSETKKQLYLESYETLL